MAHLKKLPTIFVRGEERRNAYFTVQAREYRAEGFVELGEEPAVKAPVKTELPEILVEAGVDAYDDDSIKAESNEGLDQMTKAELLDWALELGHDLKNALPKAEILKACKEIESKI